ncbi:MAG: Transketolase domain protein, partial [Steroidobacteraceae bacterium]|nr:Transketolase domain protein [Steroidobacteraceae bacterium]
MHEYDDGSQGPKVFPMPASASRPVQTGSAATIDWRRVLRTTFLSRALDRLEETRLVPERKVLYQFSARGHDVTQALLGMQLTGARDAVAPYYRSRPLALALGLSAEEALASTMMRTQGMSAGRDIGVVINLPNRQGPCMLPACGGVGTQYTPATGWAQALAYRVRVLDDQQCAGSIAVVHGGDASTATNGFWASLNIATTGRLPLLYYIEDNGYGISVRSDRQTPGGDIAANLASFRNLIIFDGDGSDPGAAATLIEKSIAAVRAGDGPVLLRLTVPRLSGHSGQDTQAYKSSEEVAAEQARDPLLRLRAQIVPRIVVEAEWKALELEAQAEVEAALLRIEARPAAEMDAVTRYAFTEYRDDGSLELQRQGGLLAEGILPAAGSDVPRPDGPRINMLTAIRRTLEHELEVNPRVLVFGEDVGRKGGVHAATLGLQERFGEQRVFDTSLSEEGIIGRAVGMALAGLMPVPEIQFRKYAPKSSSASTQNRPPSSCMTAVQCAGARPTALPHRWSCGCLAASSSAATPGTASAMKWNSFMQPAGGLRCLPMPKTPWGFCARPCAAMTRSSFSSIVRCSMARRQGALIPATISCCHSASRARFAAAPSSRSSAGARWS